MAISNEEYIKKTAGYKIGGDAICVFELGDIGDRIGKVIYTNNSARARSLSHTFGIFSIAVRRFHLIFIHDSVEVNGKNNNQGRHRHYSSNNRNAGGKLLNCVRTRTSHPALLIASVCSQHPHTHTHTVSVYRRFHVFFSSVRPRMMNRRINLKCKIRQTHKHTVKSAH